MSAPDVREILSPMLDRKVELSGPGFEVDRKQLMARISEARQSARRQQRWRRVTLMASAAAVVLAAGGLFAYQRSASNAGLEVAVSEGSATQSNGSSKAEIAKGARLEAAASGELETAEGSKANVRTTDGVNIELGAQTRVALDDLQTKSRRLKLLRGAIRCAVPHRTASQPFQVLTPDATIIDVGTVFTVSVDGPDHVTRVTVQEGEVLVRHAAGEVHVKAPGSWVSAVVTPPPLPSVAPPEPDPTAPKPVTSPGAVAPTRPSAGPALREGKTLDEEAQLLRQGLAAERQGRFSDARTALSTLLRKYPKSSVAPDARAALARVEAREQR